MIIRMMIVEWNYAPPERQNGHIVSDADKDHSMHGITHQLWGGNWRKKRSMVHVRLTIWHYTPAERRKCKYQVSITCEAHNMKLHTAWEGKMHTDKVSIAFQVRVTICNYAQAERWREGQHCMPGSQHRNTHPLRWEIGQRRGQFRMRGSQQGITHMKLDKDEVSIACAAHNYGITHRLRGENGQWWGQQQYKVHNVELRTI